MAHLGSQIFFPLTTLLLVPLSCPSFCDHDHPPNHDHSLPWRRLFHYVPFYFLKRMILYGDEESWECV